MATIASPIEGCGYKLLSALKNIVLTILLLLLPLAAHSQRGGGDTLSLPCVNIHRFSFGQTAAPASLLATGSVVTFVPVLREQINVPIHEWSQRDGHERCEVEDYVQFAPWAALPLLKACGLESRHSYRDMATLAVGASLIGVTFGLGFKYGLGVERPYGGVYNSFPSGHTLTAFLGAELLRREYGSEYPLVGIAGYTVAAGVGAMRIYNNRHWAGDVLAGAGFGILSASLMYWLAPYLQF